MRATSAAAAATLAGIGGLHVAWARGSSWPFPDRERLAAAVAGVESGDFAPPGVTYVVSGLLLGAAGLLVAAEHGPASVRPLARLGSSVAGAVLLGRGAVGLARPGLLPAGDVAPFARLNRGLYSPLCLALGVAVGSTGLKQRFDG